MTIQDCLMNQAALHPSMTPQDVMKLCYQAAFGAEHLLWDIEGARSYFIEEYQNVAPNDGPLVEWVSPQIGRVNLGPWKKAGLPQEWLFQLFVLSRPEQTGQTFDGNLKTAAALTRKGALPFTAQAWKSYIGEYLKTAVHPVHHSQAYREKEKPAYRIAAGQMIRLIPLLSHLAALPEKQGAYIIAIDGHSASGKTTMAAHLKQLLGASIVHMDDFFLPMALRTKERLAQPGGNVHYERFKSEILPNIGRTQGFEYRPFDCSKMDLGLFLPVPASKWRIVEGAYSCHPAFKDYMDVRVFSHVSKEEQALRILKRNGPEMAQMFASRWIPMEEAYFKAYDIEKKAQVTIGNTGSGILKGYIP